MREHFEALDFARRIEALETLQHTKLRGRDKVQPLLLLWGLSNRHSKRPRGEKKFIVRVLTIATLPIKVAARNTTPDPIDHEIRTFLPAKSACESNEQQSRLRLLLFCGLRAA